LSQRAVCSLFSTLPERAAKEQHIIDQSTHQNFCSIVLGEEREKEKIMSYIKYMMKNILIWATLPLDAEIGDSEDGKATERGQNRQ
jgi:hypothetical protein